MKSASCVGLTRVSEPVRRRCPDRLALHRTTVGSLANPNEWALSCEPQRLRYSIEAPKFDASFTQRRLEHAVARQLQRAVLGDGSP